MIVYMHTHIYIYIYIYSCYFEQVSLIAEYIYILCIYFVHQQNDLRLRQANITPIPKGPPSSSVANYRPISITSVLSKVFERLVSVRLGRFMERSGVLLTTQFAYRKGLGTCDALLCIPNTAECIGKWAGSSDCAD